MALVINIDGTEDDLLYDVNDSSASDDFEKCLDDSDHEFVGFQLE